MNELITLRFRAILKKYDIGNLIDEKYFDNGVYNYSIRLGYYIPPPAFALFSPLEILHKLGIHTVNGNIDISRTSLKSLKGSPRIVNGTFDVSSTKITTFEHSPKYVSGDFICNFNDITSFRGSPRKIGNHFSVFGNKLTSFEYAPEQIHGDFNIGNNPMAVVDVDPETGDTDLRFRVEINKYNLMIMGKIII